LSTKIRNIVLGIVLRNKDIKMTNIKVGIDAFNDLAKSHDAHVKEVERLAKKVELLEEDMNIANLTIKRLLENNENKA
jgi:hypothetical protein